MTAQFIEKIFLKHFEENKIEFVKKLIHSKTF